MGRSRLAGYRHPGAAADRRRHDRHRQNPFGRIRDGRLGHQPAYGYALESMGSRYAPRAGRIQRGVRGIGRSRHGALRHRHRHRRLRSATGGLVRHYRPQGHDRADQHPWRAAAQHHPGHAGAHDALGRGCGIALHRAARSRSDGSGHTAPPAGRSDARSEAGRRRAAPRGSARRRAQPRRRRDPGRLRHIDRGAGRSRRSNRPGVAAAPASIRWPASPAGSSAPRGIPLSAISWTTRISR